MIAGFFFFFFFNAHVISPSLSAVGAVHQAAAERCEHRGSRLKGEDLPEPHDRRAGHQQQTVRQSHAFTPGTSNYNTAIDIPFMTFVFMEYIHSAVGHCAHMSTVHTVQYTVDGRLGIFCKQPQKASTSDPSFPVCQLACGNVSKHNFILSSHGVFSLIGFKKMRFSNSILTQEGAPRLHNFAFTCLGWWCTSVAQIPNTFEINQPTRNQMTGSGKPGALCSLVVLGPRVAIFSGNPQLQIRPRFCASFVFCCAVWSQKGATWVEFPFPCLSFKPCWHTAHAHDLHLSDPAAGNKKLSFTATLKDLGAKVSFSFLETVWLSWASVWGSPPEGHLPSGRADGGHHVVWHEHTHTRCSQQDQGEEAVRCVKLEGWTDVLHVLFVPRWSLWLWSACWPAALSRRRRLIWSGSQSWGRLWRRACHRRHGALSPPRTHVHKLSRSQSALMLVPRTDSAIFRCNYIQLWQLFQRNTESSFIMSYCKPQCAALLSPGSGGFKCKTMLRCWEADLTLTTSKSCQD